MTTEERLEFLERELARAAALLVRIQENQIMANDALIETREWVLEIKASAAAG